MGGYLHFLHRSNTPFGNQPHQVIVVPTMKGMYFMDNELIPETDLALGVFTTDVQLQRYGIRRHKAKICLLHYHYYDTRNMVRPLQHFIEHNTYMEQQPAMDIFHRLGGINDDMLSRDLLQKELFTLFSEQKRLDDIRNVEDVEVDRRELWEQAHAELETQKWLELKELREKVNAEYFKRKAEFGLKRKTEAVDDTDLEERGGFILAVVSREEGIKDHMRGWLVEKCNLLNGGMARGIGYPNPDSQLLIERTDLEEKLKEVQQMFQSFDDDGYGFLKVADFIDICNNWYGKPKKDNRWTLEKDWDPEMPEEDMKEILKLADPDNTGEIYYEVFVKAMRTSVEEMNADIQKKMEKQLKEKQRQKETALKLKPEVLATPQVASNATMSEKL